MSGHRYTVRGLELAWHELGAVTSAPPERTCLCLHGFMDHGRSYAALAQELGAEWRVIAPDFRGHGESGWIGAGGYYHFYDYYDDMRALMQASGFERGVVIGHSMGGSVAVGIAALFPERVGHLVLLEGMGPFFESLADSVDRLRRWAEALGAPALSGDEGARRRGRKPMGSVEDAATRLRTANPRLPAARARELAESFTEPAPGGVVWRFDPLHRTPAAKPFLREEAEPLWRAVRAPVLSLFGLESGWRPDGLSARHQALANATVAYVPGGGHNLHHDRPELVARAVAAFVGGAPLPSDLSMEDGPC